MTAASVGELVWPDSFAFYLAMPQPNGQPRWTDLGDGRWRLPPSPFMGYVDRPLFATTGQGAAIDPLPWDFDEYLRWDLELVADGEQTPPGQAVAELLCYAFDPYCFVHVRALQASLLGGPPNALRVQFTYADQLGNVATYTRDLLSSLRQQIRLYHRAGNVELQGTGDGGESWTVLHSTGTGVVVGQRTWTVTSTSRGEVTYHHLGGPVTPAKASSLYQRMPDGGWANVGTAERPVSIRMPDGSMRTWPGSDTPLYQLGPDGTWRQVI